MLHLRWNEKGCCGVFLFFWEWRPFKSCKLILLKQRLQSSHPSLAWISHTLYPHMYPPETENHLSTKNKTSGGTLFYMYQLYNGGYITWLRAQHCQTGQSNWIKLEELKRMRRICKWGNTCYDWIATIEQFAQQEKAMIKMIKREQEEYSLKVRHCWLPTTVHNIPGNQEKCPVLWSLWSYWSVSPSQLRLYHVMIETKTRGK